MLLMFVRGKSVVLMARNEMDDMPEIQRATASATTEPTTPKPTGNRPPTFRGGTADEKLLLDAEGKNPKGPTPPRAK